MVGRHRQPGPDVRHGDLILQNILPFSPSALLPHTHYLPVTMDPTSAFCLSIDSTTSRALSALHCLPTHTWMPTDAKFGSLQEVIGAIQSRAAQTAWQAEPSMQVTADLSLHGLYSCCGYSIPPAGATGSGARWNAGKSRL